jgi:hypothetical protein
LIENCIYKSTKNIELTQNFDILIWNELNLGVIGKKYKTLQQRKEINTLHDYAKELICKEKISNDIDCPYTIGKIKDGYLIKKRYKNFILKFKIHLVNNEVECSKDYFHNDKTPDDMLEKPGSFNGTLKKEYQ